MFGMGILKIHFWVCRGKCVMEVSWHGREVDSREEVIFIGGYGFTKLFREGRLS